jgi:hypothetical protein
MAMVVMCGLILPVQPLFITNTSASAWRAYEEEPFTTKLLFQEVTEFKDKWLGAWPKPRLL